MHDKYGKPIQTGDSVIVPCIVESTTEADEYCNVNLKTMEPMFPGNAPSTVVLNARQTVKRDPVSVGSHVTYVDPVGKRRDAVVTAVWGDPKWNPSINIVFVTDDIARQDNYGAQIERKTSVVNRANQPAHGEYWMYAD
jgi:hypothetical protein